MDLKGLVSELLSELGKVSKSDAVVGTVRDAGKAKVLPLSRISIGFGTATGEVGGTTGEGGPAGAGAAGGGAGGAIVVEPRAFVVVGEDGVPHMLALERGKTAVARPGVRILPNGDAAARARGERSACARVRQKAERRLKRRRAALAPALVQRARHRRVVGAELARALVRGPRAR
ncbi:MAG: spore germination protein GerW family protein [Polyangiaceae bacterium]